MLAATVAIALAVTGCAAADRSSSGGRTVQVVDAGGPMGAPGSLYAAWTLPALLDATGKTDSLACARGCWRGASPPEGDLLVGVLLSPSDCFRITRGTTREVAPGAVLVELEAERTCTGGGGMATQAGLTLVAVPVSAAERAAPALSLTVGAALPEHTVEVGRLTVRNP